MMPSTRFLPSSIMRNATQFAFYSPQAVVRLGFENMTNSPGIEEGQKQMEPVIPSRLALKVGVIHSRIGNALPKVVWVQGTPLTIREDVIIRFGVNGQRSVMLENLHQAR